MASNRTKTIQNIREGPSKPALKLPP